MELCFFLQLSSERHLSPYKTFKQSQNQMLKSRCYEKLVSSLLSYQAILSLLQRIKDGTTVSCPCENDACSLFLLFQRCPKLTKMFKLKSVFRNGCYWVTAYRAKASRKRQTQIPQNISKISRSKLLRNGGVTKILFSQQLNSLKIFHSGPC